MSSEDVHEFWTRELAEGKEAWYSKSLSYWKHQADTDNSLLGGFAEVNTAEIRESAEFLKQVRQRINNGASANPTHVLEGGCGNGRVSRQLLRKFFDQIDLAEPVGHLLTRAEASIQTQLHASYCVSLQDFNPEPYMYASLDARSSASDDSAAAMTVSGSNGCRTALKSHGYLIIKENVSRRVLVKDDEDSSVTRSDAHFKTLFSRSGWKLLHEDHQKEWPEMLYHVKMYALVPTPSQFQQS